MYCRETTLTLDSPEAYLIEGKRVARRTMLTPCMHPAVTLKRPQIAPIKQIPTAKAAIMI